MAVVTVKSTQITNRDASPSVINDSAYAKGIMKKAVGEAVITSGNSIASIYVLCSIPSNAVVSSVLVSSPDIGTTTTGHFGLYKTTAQGGAVVDADFFKATVSLKDGAIAKSEVAFGNVMTYANSYKKVWQHLALAADPQINYDVCLTLDAAADGTGTIMVEVQYTE